ncbi:MAG: hypothetical protein V8T86_10405 [Victivallis sp.]
MNNQKTISELRIPVRTKFDAEGQPVRRPEAGGREARMVQTIREFDPGRKELIRLACDAARRIDEITLEDIRYCMSCTHPRVRIETVGAAASFVQGYVTRIAQLEKQHEIDQKRILELKIAVSRSGDEAEAAHVDAAECRIRISELEAENRRLDSLNGELQGINRENTLMLSRMTTERDRVRKALRELMQAVDGCLTPHEALLWKKCEEAMKGVAE